MEPLGGLGTLAVVFHATLRFILKVNLLARRMAVVLLLFWLRGLRSKKRESFLKESI